jgi:T4-like virus Myoviridae tail sheath stabiliser
MPDFFYDQQFRRYAEQFVRIFANFSWQTGIDTNGMVSQQVVPSTYAQQSRMVANIINNNSPNTLPTVPQITCWIKELAIARQRTQAPNFIGKLVAQERHFDVNTQEYTSEPGYVYQVDRYMPVPFDLTLEVDIWTSNEVQKQQLLEQILIMFNPSLDIQTDVNAIDWSSLTVVELTSINYTSRSLNQGTSNEIDITTLNFRVPIWLNPPAKLKKSVVIREIITNIVQAGEQNCGSLIPDETGRTDGLFYTQNQILARLITTFSDYKIKVSGTNVSLLTTYESNIGPDGKILTWKSLLTKYGEVRPNVSMLRLKTNADLEDTSTDITGEIQYDPNDPNNLILALNIDTLPQNTLPPLTAIIEPHKVYPGTGLPDVAVGQYYLSLQDIGTPTVAWGGVIFNSNDIITWNGTEWTVIFSASATNNTTQYVVNSKTGTQYRFDINYKFWTNSYEGIYNPGFWSIYV